MKRLLILPVAFLLSCCSGTQTPQEEKNPDMFAFSQTELALREGDSVDIPVSFKKWDRGVYVEATYDFKSNPKAVNVTSSDPAVAVFNDGQIKGVKAGTAIFKIAQTSAVKSSGQLAVTVREASVPEPQTVKLLYWNIQNGMWSDQGNNYDNFVKFVKEQDPDICIWAEAKTHYKTDSDEAYKTTDKIYLPDGWKELAARYGHDYVYLGAERDWFPQVVTSKFPIDNVKRITGDGSVTVSHGCGWAKMLLAGIDLNIVTVHTWPQKYGFNVNGSVNQEASAARNEGDLYREKEVKHICEQTILTHKDASNEYWIMAGDFNAESSADNYKLNYPAGDTRLLVHDYIRSNTPYVDIIEKQYPGVFQKSTRSGKRVDFVYLTNPLVNFVTDAHIIWDGFAASVKDTRFSFSHPSDHYPISVTFSIPASK